MTEALKMDPAYIEAYTNLGRMYLDSTSEKQRQKGEHLWRIAYMLNHNNPRVRENLIDLFESQGKHDLAEMVLKHEKLPAMEDFMAARKEKYKQAREERKYRLEQKAKEREEAELEFDERNVPASAESVVTKGDNIQSQHYGNEDVIDNKIPEPTEQIMREPRAELAGELGNMVNSII